MTIPEHATRKSLPQTILEYFGERPKGNSPALTKQVIKFLDDNEIRVLILDEGDRFIRDSFEVLKDFHDAGVRRELKCRFAIAGLPELLDLIKEHGQFSSRAPSVLEVEPLTDEEIIDKFLPNLTIPRWRFNPANRIDQELAKLMWQRTTPTLRLLIAWISKASGLAKLRGKDWVTIEEVGDAAVVLFFGKADKKKLELSEGIHERISELRNAFKALKNAGK